MHTRTRLLRSIPFWVLVVGSLASIVYGVLQLIEKLSVMETTLTDGTATGVEVYVGQSVVVVAAILIGAGIVGLALALSLATAAKVFAPVAPAVEVIDWDADEVADEEPAAEALETEQPVAEELDADAAEVEAAPAR
ncbi:dinucleotide-utilizing enzyme [Microbacterium fluvii]|uniref:Dinucleotide-utilizing enzyme n=1 Tax=Microbacterium fluvii TaxID=415215 RepID=A0ABW2HEU7_9MICO|nr:dinucleotide-utilizing enzyme [Microbacterium fluvii]MCU4672620.1 dinucleotide-utilizing enzyme [Microbacterium fluvii]